MSAKKKIDLRNEFGKKNFFLGTYLSQKMPMSVEIESQLNTAY